MFFPMLRYLKIYALLLRNSLIREMSFKANFLLWTVVEVLWFFGQVLFIRIGSDTSKLASTLGSLRLRNRKSLYPQESQRIGSYVPCGV